MLRAGLRNIGSEKRLYNATIEIENIMNKAPSEDQESLPLTDIERPRSVDVTSGKGQGSNFHPGNKAFRVQVEESFHLYGDLPATGRKAGEEKKKVAANLVKQFRSQGVRFLKQQPSGRWDDIGDEGAKLKTLQLLRDIKKRRDREAAELLATDSLSDSAGLISVLNSSPSSIHAATKSSGPPGLAGPSYFSHPNDISGRYPSNPGYYNDHPHSYYYHDYDRNRHYERRHPFKHPHGAVPFPESSSMSGTSPQPSPPYLGSHHLTESINPGAGVMQLPYPTQPTQPYGTPMSGAMSSPLPPSPFIPMSEGFPDPMPQEQQRPFPVTPGFEGYDRGLIIPSPPHVDAHDIRSSRARSYPEISRQPDRNFAHEQPIQYYHTYPTSRTEHFPTAFYQNSQEIESLQNRTFNKKHRSSKKSQEYSLNRQKNLPERETAYPHQELHDFGSNRQEYQDIRHAHSFDTSYSAAPRINNDDSDFIGRRNEESTIDYQENPFIENRSRRRKEHRAIQEQPRDIEYTHGLESSFSHVRHSQTAQDDVMDDGGSPSQRRRLNRFEGEGGVDQETDVDLVCEALLSSSSSSGKF